MGRMVTLIDGSEVPSDSDAYRLECLARRVSAMPWPERSGWLAGFEHRHGQHAVLELIETMRALDEGWQQARQGPYAPPGAPIARRRHRGVAWNPEKRPEVDS